MSARGSWGRHGEVRRVVRGRKRNGEGGREGVCGER